jgi:alpha-galactosidase
MIGMLGITGDIASLPEDAKQRLAYNIKFYKKWRKVIVGSKAHLLTPPELINNHLGWLAIQLQDPINKRSLLFVYRLYDGCHERIVRLRGLDPGRTYSVVNEENVGSEPQLITGEGLMNNGLSVGISDRYGAAIIAIL